MTKCTTCVLVLFLLFSSICATASTGTTVESVQAEIRVDKEQPHPQVVKRMSASVKTIGEHILLGRSVIEVTEKKNEYEKIVRDVFDRVMIGYTVLAVEIEPASVTRIVLHFVPWGDGVRDVNVKVDFSGIAPETVVLLKGEVEMLTEQIQAAIIGLPVDAVDWAGGVTREIIREILRRKLPDFNFVLDVEPGKITSVKLSLVPIGAVIRETAVSLRSETIPNLLLIHARPELELVVQRLRGLPLSFVEKRLDYFQAQIHKAVAEDPVIRPFHLIIKPAIHIAASTIVDVAVETQAIRMNAEAYLDVGRSKDNVSARAHIGRIIGGLDELFLEMQVTPGTLSWDVMPGWGHNFSRTTTAGVKYRINDQQTIFWMNQGLGGRWSVRAERIPGINWNEAALRYRLHDFLSVELVISNEMNWLRLIGHL